MQDTEDFGVSPLTEAKDTKFKSGVSGNPAGRPKGSKRPRSKMRSQLEKLCELQADALEIIRMSMTGKDSKGDKVGQPAKEVVDMAKFVVNKIESLNKTCLSEEMAIINIRKGGDSEGAKTLEENQEELDATSTGAFSLDMETKH